MAERLDLKSNIIKLKGIGEARAEAFYRLGIENIGDLLGFFPRTYEARGRVKLISDALENEPCSFIVTVRETSQPRYIRGKLNVFRSRVFDESGIIDLVFFNSPFMAKALASGRRFRVYGRVKKGLRGLEMISPKLEPIIEGKALPYFYPIYRISPPLTQKTIVSAVGEALKLAESLTELLPESVIKSHGLMPRAEAVRTLHNPTDELSLSRARKTISLAEISVFRLALASMRFTRKGESANRLGLKNCGIKAFFENIPFELTEAQKRAVKEIFADLESDRPMARLLQGDVGSGKTVVAAAAIYLCVKNGFQACLMAPTEILASQHKKTLDKFLSPFRIKTELLVSGLPASEKKRVRASLENGETNVVVGTHALITDKTVFNNCALAVADEQHRFGVRQRAALLEKSERNGVRAHMLVMSATPIPRSLSLIIFGDLDVSVLDELPPNRKPIETKVVSKDKINKVYESIKKEISSGGRAYIVCPLIEDSEDSDNEKRAAESYFRELSEGEFKDIPMGLLHGRMRPSEKASVMADFAEGKTKILVSTTVIEVGVDVPEATVMVIENAEMFGLSQLHQLRGRIGRGERKSYCILVNGGAGDSGAERLAVMRDNSDGFKIAEADLVRRGPGDFFGERQSGEFSFAVSAMADISLLAETDSIVKELLQNKALPENKPIFDAADEFLERAGGLITVN